jgi:hypothetical protein
MAKTTQQLTPIVLFFLIFKWTKCQLPLSHFGSQFYRSDRQHILTIEHAIHEGRVACYRRPPIFTKEEGQLSWQSLLKLSVLYALFSSLKPWKCHNADRWISFLFQVVCLAAPINLPTASAFYSKCACTLESLNDIAKTDFRSVINPKEYTKITYFYSGTNLIAKRCFCFIEHCHCEKLIITHIFKKFPKWMAVWIHTLLILNYSSFFQYGIWVI